MYLIINEYKSDIQQIYAVVLWIKYFLKFVYAKIWEQKFKVLVPGVPATYCMIGERDAAEF